MQIAKLNKSILEVSGQTASELLNGLITQEINKISPSNPIYCLFLNSKGRVLYSTIIYMLKENSFAIEIEPEQTMELAEHIHKYDIAQSLEISILDNLCVGITNEKSTDFFTDPRSEKLPFRGLVENNFVSNEEFLAEYENTRLQLAIPENQDFIKEKTLANELNIEQLNGVSFTKGCYLGQELTSRTKHIKSSKYSLISIPNEYNITQKNLTIFDNNKKVIGQTFSYNSKFVLATIKVGNKIEKIK